MSGPTETKVYVGRLSESSLKELEADLDDPGFQRIETSKAKAAIISEIDELMVSVPREHMVQTIAFVSPMQRKPYERSLTPLLTWMASLMKDLQKEKVPIAKGERFDNCHAPEVLYQRSLSANPEVKDEPPNQ